MARPPTVSRPWLFNDGPPDLTLDLLWRVYATALSQVYYCPPKGSRIQRSLLPQAATGKMQKQILEARFGDVGIGHHYISFSRQTHRISQ